MRQKTDAPWLALGISRATWYRQGKPTTRRKRQTQAMTAKQTGLSLRSMQRAFRVAREVPDLALQVQAGEMTLGAAERIIKERWGREAMAMVLAGIIQRDSFEC
jgi:hypothetical protein